MEFNVRFAELRGTFVCSVIRPKKTDDCPKAPCLQGFSPLFDCADFFAEKGEFGEKMRDSNRFV